MLMLQGPILHVQNSNDQCFPSTKYMLNLQMPCFDLLCALENTIEYMLKHLYDAKWDTSLPYCTFP